MAASPLDNNKKKTNMKVQKIPSSLEDGEAAHTLVHGLRALIIFLYIYYLKYQTVHLIIIKKLT